MVAFLSKAQRFIKSEDGPTAVEYAVMLALILVACIGIVTTLGKSISGTFTTVNSARCPRRAELKRMRCFDAAAADVDRETRDGNQIRKSSNLLSVTKYHHVILSRDSSSLSFLNATCRAGRGISK